MISWLKQSRSVILSPDSVLWPPLDQLGHRVREARPRTLAESSREHILQVLQDTDWVVGRPDGASALLGLKEFVGERKEGLVFANRKGRPLAQSNVLRRHLHPLLEALRSPKTGFHSFRRFRTTHLRKQRVPEDLLRFWIGHSDTSITDKYSKLQEDGAYRREVTDKVGLGFEIKPPSVVRIVRKVGKSPDAQIAA